MRHQLGHVEPEPRTVAQISALRGRVLNLHRVLAHNPEALDSFMVVSRHVRDDSRLEPKLRELTIVTIATVLGNMYELGHHVPLARSLGVTDDQLRALPDWTRSDLFSAQESAVVRYAGECTADRHASDETMSLVFELLSPPEAVDLALTVGWYHLCHVLIDSFAIEMDA